MFRGMLGICALCKLNADLQYSHILPEFFYKQIYDPPPKKGFHVVSAVPSDRDEFMQKGLREHLLCTKCEGILSRWETKAKSAFLDSEGIQVTQHEQAIALSDLDYTTFKLFQLSLLWRMSVTKLDFF